MGKQKISSCILLETDSLW